MFTAARRTSDLSSQTVVFFTNGMLIFNPARANAEIFENITEILVHVN